MQIDTGVRIPNIVRHKVSRYPFDNMEVNDSFFLACTDDDVTAASARLRASASSYGRRRGKRFVTRRVEGGVRVWRVE